MKNILIVEDHYLVTMSLRFILGEVSQNFNISDVQNFEDALKEIKAQNFDLIILDIYVPGGKGLKMVDIIKKEDPDVSILICSAVPEEQFAERFILAGANGFISKSASQDEFIQSITTIMKGGRYASEKINAKLLSQEFSRKKPNLSLTPREAEITALLLKGLWIKEIANALNLSASTISTFKARIFKKMEVDSIVGLKEKLEADDLTYSADRSHW